MLPISLSPGMRRKYKYKKTDIYENNIRCHIIKKGQPARMPEDESFFYRFQFAGAEPTTNCTVIMVLPPPNVFSRETFQL